MLIIAHLSDLHLGGKGDPPARLRRALRHLAAHEPPVDVVLITGDIADHGTAEEYADAAAIVAEWPGPAPVLWCIGNHDVREGSAAMRGLPSDRPANEAHVVAGALFVMADSMVPAPPGERIDHGWLVDETLAWIDAELAGRPPGQRAFVCLHHPPVEIQIGLMDPIRLRNSEALASILDRHDDVVAVLVGHAHSACATAYHQMRRPLPVLIPGGIVSTVTLDAEPLEEITTELPLTYALHFVSDVSEGSPDSRARIVTHWRSLPAS